MNFQSTIEAKNLKFISGSFQNHQEILIVRSEDNFYILKKIYDDEELILNKADSSIKLLLNNKFYNKKSFYNEMSNHSEQTTFIASDTEKNELIDNTQNPLYKSLLNFQTYYGWINYENEKYFIFEYFSDNLENLKSFHIQHSLNIAEETLIKITQSSFQAIDFCLKNGICYPEISLKNILIMTPILKKNESTDSNIIKTKLVHPFLFRSFFHQITQKLISSRLSSSTHLIKEQFYQNVNELGVIMLSLSTNIELHMNDFDGIQNCLDIVKNERSSVYFSILQKFDYFKEKSQFCKENNMFEDLSNFLMGLDTNYNHSNQEIDHRDVYCL